MDAHNTPTQDNCLTPPTDGAQDGFNKVNTYTVAGRVFIVEPVFKDDEAAPETFGAILLKLMLESEKDL